MPIWSKMTLQNSNSPMMEQMSFFHDHCMTILTLITLLTGVTAFSAMKSTPFQRFSEENQEMEMFWSTIPAMVLIMIAFPSLKILYMTEESSSTSISIKTTGHQWYWSYEYADLKEKEWDSYMEESNNRLLETDKHLILPINTQTQVISTSSDVIHSWTIPSLGIKADAVPGRMNQMNTSINRPGILSGQCSEICGANHSFMPISISALSQEEFIKSMK